MSKGCSIIICILYLWKKIQGLWQYQDHQSHEQFACKVCFWNHRNAESSVLCSAKLLKSMWWSWRIPEKARTCARSLRARGSALGSFSCRISCQMKGAISDKMGWSECTYRCFSLLWIVQHQQQVFINLVEQWVLTWCPVFGLTNLRESLPPILDLNFSFSAYYSNSAGM